MFRRRSAISVCLTWAMVAIAVWISWPSSACICADGGFKLFCDAQSRPSAGQPSCAGDCCQHRALIAQPTDANDCCQHQVALGNGRTGQRCTPVLNPPAVAPVPASIAVSCDQATAVPIVAIECPYAAIGFSHAWLASLDTGPPLDRVIVLQRLLI